MRTMILCFILGLLFYELKGQTTPSPLNAGGNIYVFSGYFAKRQNANENGKWVGAYGDIPIFRSLENGWNLGFWSLYALSGWQNNLSGYAAKNQDLVFGLTSGYYTENLSWQHSLYVGVAIGYKTSSDEGQIRKKNYAAESVQTDKLVSGSLNVNIIKHSGLSRFFPRSQLGINYQKPISSEKKFRELNQGGHWKEANAWDKKYVDMIFKQSIFDVALGYSQSTFLQPKLGWGYSHSFGDKLSSQSLIIELSVHRIDKDDFLSLSWAQKFYPGHDLGILMISINLLKFKQKNL